MSQRERYGTRDLTYSHWHRSDSMQRFLGRLRALQLTALDIDFVEYCYRCKEPLAFIETARDVGQSFKATQVTVNVARRVGAPAALVYWLPDAQGDIESFRIREVYPEVGSERLLSPTEFAGWLWLLRVNHLCRLAVVREESA